MISEMFWINLSDDESEEENASHWKEHPRDEIIPPEATVPVETNLGTDSKIEDSHMPVISDGAVNLGPKDFSTSPTAVAGLTEGRKEGTTENS